MTNPSPTNPTWTADEHRAADVARARVQARYRGTGRYPVTVGGYIIGHVQRQRVRYMTRAETEWAIYDDDGTQLPGSYSSRTVAVRNLARLTGVVTYRTAALEGVFGDPEKARILAELDTDDDDVCPLAGGCDGVDCDFCAPDSDEDPPARMLQPSSDDLPPAAELAAKVRAIVGTEPVVCAYFATCDRQAVGTLPNPVLGPVATCQRCADQVGAGDRIQRYAGVS